MNATQLRINGFSVNSAGHIECNRRRESASRYSPCERYAHERTGVVIITGPREVVDQVIAAVDEPAALVGRTSRGNAAMLFRIAGAMSTTTRRLEMRDGSEVSIVWGCDEMSLNPELYQWPRGRSPADVRRNDLPPLLSDHGEAAYAAAWAAGARPADEFQRERDFAARVAAAGPVVEESETDRIQREQEQLVADHAGRDIGQADGPFAELILAARRAVAWRRSKQNAA